MRFGPVPAQESEGAILAHTVSGDGRTWKKGHRLSAGDAAALAAAGLSPVTVARLEPGDVHEDRAAARLAAACQGPGITAGEATTGRVNLFATGEGIMPAERGAIDAVNAVDEALTLATLDPYARVSAGQMVATIKIIPFAVPEDALAEAEARARAAAPLLAVAAYRPRPVALIQTTRSDLKDKVLDKTAAITAQRLDRLGGWLSVERRCGHREEALAAELAAVLAGGAEMVLIAGASAITDRRDVLPAAIVARSGRIDHFGMPVDPGNLLLLGGIGPVPVLGLPGCARSPKINGLDWVMARLMADQPVGARAIMGLGAGGLLAEIESRPSPRREADRPAVPCPAIAAIILAAGQSRRMGARNKLLAPVAGESMIRRAAGTATASRVAETIVVTGHEAEAIATELADLPVRIVHNPDYASGLASSLKTGLAAVSARVQGAIIIQADMPHLRPGHLDALIAAFDPAQGRTLCQSAHEGRRGNPVLWGREYFGEMQALTGDTGAKPLLQHYRARVHPVEMGDAAIFSDVDTPEALAALEQTEGTS